MTVSCLLIHTIAHIYTQSGGMHTTFEATFYLVFPSRSLKAALQLQGKKKSFILTNLKRESEALKWSKELADFCILYMQTYISRHVSLLFNKKIKWMTGCFLPVPIRHYSIIWKTKWYKGYQNPIKSGTNIRYFPFYPDFSYFYLRSGIFIFFTKIFLSQGLIENWSGLRKRIMI